ncbi:hypothetical protein LF927_08425 [Pectobacterium polaris]|uniref:ApeA N-terminal domain 1-containing protein n=1 Tax=Pectobacterium polaris TaxID=2042057 RepID=UPI001CF3F6C9|nr:HEPN domain-containing protein [Pectobacterium polaris]MCA6941207.1 hypothetical protein [Pectobacterium polaris]MCA6955475.1 hypothetical protein [Pectobacterium polaris]
MTTESNSFYQKQKIDVIVDIDGRSLHGTLQFGGFEIPVFCLKNDGSPSVSVFFVYIRDKTELTCTSLGDGKIYTLHGIKLDELVVSADYVTMGKQYPHFDKFELHLTGISVWIEGNRGFSLNSDCLERSINTETISESFRFDSSNYIFSTNYHIDTHNQTPVKSHFSIEHTLVIQKVEGNFSFEECKKISHELRNLFSLLIGNSLSVSEIWIFNHGDPTRTRWLYFPTVLYAQEPLQNAFDAISRFTNLNEEKKWGTILSHFFSKNSFRNIWNRIVPSYGKMGAWEYDILSRVVTLEMYAGVKATGKRMKMERSLNRDFMNELKKTIDAFANSRNPSGENRIVFDGMAKSILDTKNTSLPTLREKYEELIRELSPSLRDAVSFTDDDFSRIKKIRDSTAHGLDYERQSLSEDITHEMQLSDRLLVLLMCFVYLELGFNENEIASLLKSSHCGFISDSGLNKRELDRLSGCAVFIKLTESPKHMTLRSHDMVVVNHSTKADTWYLNEEITRKLGTEWRNSGISFSLDYVKNIVPYKDGQTFELKQQAYIESEENETEHFLTVIIHS